MAPRRVQAGRSVVEALQAAVRTARTRGRVYGDAPGREGHWRHGRVMAALYPEGLTCRTPEEFTRAAAMNNLVQKLVRYTEHPAGHPDSIHDLGVYAFILETIDAHLDNRR